ncbi:MAG TPA: DMT family transporter [Burkholderiaceae bacterium]
MTDRDPRALVRAMPWVFVVIWSTGFVVARFGMPHAPPLTFLSLRYALSVLCFGVWIALARAAWPKGRAQWGHLAVTGVLMQAGYLGGVWAAIKHGIAAGTVSLIVGLQPVLTALWVSFVASRRRHANTVTAGQWLGLLLGLAGLVLVVWRKLGVGEVNALNFGLSLLALLSITIGALYQKRHVAPCDVRTASCVQMLAALAVSLPFALIEHEPLVWHPQLIGALAWSVLVLTLGGSSLLFILLQRGAATRVTSLFYLVPPCTALMAWVLFDELLTPAVLAGMALAALGVWLAVRTPVSPPAPLRATSIKGETP